MKLNTLKNSALHISCQNLAQSTEMSVVADSHAVNADRVHAYGTKLEELLDWARSGRDKIMALHAATSKPGGKEELELWAKVRKPAESLILNIEKRISNLGVPASGESLALRAEKRNRRVAAGGGSRGGPRPPPFFGQRMP